ncbi:DUF2845 domain-containing protein [Hyalangium rubrum]|uniref:DUF2845 domain-containing protein n=1 Tax=Hyalangium rubrum TaxID=3103134 RepID=A0ABU5H3F6_9BACT|nr:DUF2845 domain-containing protein [Hyalangium sp. s54d21]MDY7227993.1 DUF2845 domain-containing protein [Hyalangium sp. s54d21]
MRSLLMALALVLLSAPTLSHAASLRCGTGLVADGASKTDVLMKCGEPIAKDSRTERTEVKTRDEDSDSSTKQITETHIEEWTYNFGPTKFMQVVVFKNGLLVEVRSANRGH